MYEKVPEPLAERRSETDHLNTYEQFLAREMPAVLGNMLEDEFRAYDNVTKRRIVSIVEEARAKLFHQFRSTSKASPPALALEDSPGGLQQQGALDLEASQLPVSNSIFGDLDMSDIDAYIDQYIGQGRGATVTAPPGGEFGSAFCDHSQNQYATGSGLYLPILEGFMATMPYNEIGQEVGGWQ